MHAVLPGRRVASSITHAPVDFITLSLVRRALYHVGVTGVFPVLTAQYPFSLPPLACVFIARGKPKNV